MPWLGRPWTLPPQLSAGQLTLPQLGEGVDYAHHITTFYLDFRAYACVFTNNFVLEGVFQNL